MRTLIYTHVKDQFAGSDMAKTLRGSKDTSSVRVIEFWEGEIERCDLVITDNAKVRDAYVRAGIKVKPFSETPTTSVVPERIVAKPENVDEGVLQEPTTRRGRSRKVD